MENHGAAQLVDSSQAASDVLQEVYHNLKAVIKKKYGQDGAEIRLKHLWPRPETLATGCVQRGR